MTYIRKENGTCKCGRSPTGDCIGWHKLTEEQYQEKTEEDKEKMRRWFNEKYDIEEDDIQRESPRPLP